MIASDSEPAGIAYGCSWSASIFFFQAEDGIRDDLVTGVQTCALPIFARDHQRADASALDVLGRRAQAVEHHVHIAGDQVRSEERRVGKECRSRWSPYH